jgi:Na+/H+ antiporter NhaD/arsenite permease-like protein
LKALAGVLFVITYILLLALPKTRTYVALGAGALFVILGILPVDKVFSSIDWNVILMIAGTMGIVYFFIESRMPALLADWIMMRVPDVKWAMVALALFAGLISAFVDNVATVLMVAPVAMDIAKRLKISPIPMIIAIAVSSNLQGAATLVGDTTAILLGGYAGMNFLDFFFMQGKLGMFWIVQAGAVSATFVLLYIFRDHRQQVTIQSTTVVEDYFPTWLLSVMIVLLIVASFVPNTPATINGMICMSLFLVGLIRQMFVSKNTSCMKDALASIDYPTILLLLGLFVMIGGIVEIGLVNDISQMFVKVGSGNIFFIYTLIVWGSALVSAFIDNIPFVATMLPVVSGIASTLGVDPTLLYFGLLSGATLGGNLLPIGSSAGIAGLGILRKEGYEATTKDFLQISVPFDIISVTVAYVLIWVIWS